MKAGWEKPVGMALAVALVATLGIGMAVAAGKGGSGGSGKSGGHHSGKSQSRHHHHNHNNRGVFAAGVFVGGPWWPWWDYPAYYPPVALAAVPVVYIERGEQEGQTTTDWLYCAQAQGYFPYVAECAAGWERVPASPLK